MAKGTGSGGGKATSKASGKGGGKGVPNKHLHARIAYLNQAATYMAMQQTLIQKHTGGTANEVGSELVLDATMEPNSDTQREVRPPGTYLVNRGLPNLYASHLRAVSLKSQLRLSQDVKRSICKVCNSPLILEMTLTEHVENLSKGGKKPQAEVRVIHCLNCGVDKRLPVGASRQLKKSQRRALRQQDGEATQLVTRGPP